MSRWAARLGRGRERRHGRSCSRARARQSNADKQALLFYLYVENLAAVRDHLLATGVPVAEIRDGSPGPRGRWVATPMAGA